MRVTSTFTGLVAVGVVGGLIVAYVNEHYIREKTKDQSRPAPVLEPNARIVRFGADRTNIGKCESTVLRWTVDHATHVFLDGAEQEAQSGSLEVRPLVNTSYELRAQGSGGAAVSQQTNIGVIPPNSPGPPACGEIVWTGNVGSDGEVRIEAAADGISSDPPAVRVSGNLPHAQVTVTAPDGNARVISQPYESGHAAISLDCRQRGLTTLRLWWAMVHRTGGARFP